MLGKLKFGKNNRVKLLGVIIYNKLKFDNHIIKICRKANSKLSALSRLARYLSMKQEKLPYMSLTDTQFKFWMLCSRSCKNKINKLQERTLRLVYDDHELSFCVLLNKTKSFSIHHQNIQKLINCDIQAPK